MSDPTSWGNLPQPPSPGDAVSDVTTGLFGSLLSPMPPSANELATRVGDDQDMVAAGVHVGPSQRGSFTLLKPHAAGGLGQIHLARDERLGRQVALKEIRPEKAGSASIRQRFLTEAAITGQLEHPGIIPVYALDHDGEGQPYYVMRFIQGQNLHEAIKTHHQQPTVIRFRELLHRFLTICQTMAYVHSKGIIHRDLKPANVMLGEFGETLVLDWGVAKQLTSEKCRLPTAEAHVGGNQQSIIDNQQFQTQAGQIVGTLNYMAPEQAKGNLAELSTAADIFALGSILYELLTGQAPYAGVPLLTLGYQVQLGKFPPPGKVKKDVPRALEAICMKAMALSPQERYACAMDLARDVENWLADEPVSVFRANWPTRFGRWARRHRTLTASLAVLLLTAVIALTVGTFLLGQANDATRQERNAALAAQAEAEQARTAAEVARKEALASAAEARRLAVEAAAVTDFLVQDMIQMALPGAKGRDLTVRQALDTASARVGYTFRRTSMEAGLRMALGNSYLVLGQPVQADTHFQRAYDLRKQRFGAEHSASVEALAALAAARASQGRQEEALQMRYEVLQLQERHRGPEHADTARAILGYSTSLKHFRRHEEAEPLLRRALELFRRQERSEGRELHDTILTRQALGGLLVRMGQVTEGTKLHQEAVAGFERLYTKDHPATLQAYIARVALLRDAKLPVEAEALARDTLPRMRKNMGDDHPLTLQLENGLIAALMQQLKFAEAEKLSATLLDRARRVLTKEHATLKYAYKNRIAILLALGRLGEAQQLNREATGIGANR